MAATIQYPHRSVKDYLQSPRAQGILSMLTGTHPHLRLCSAYLVRFKSQYSQAHGEQVSWTGGLLGLETAYCLKHASMVSNQNSKATIAIMEILRKSLLPGQAADAMRWAPKLLRLNIFSSEQFYHGAIRSICKEAEFFLLMVIFKVVEHVKYILTQTREVAQQPETSLWKSRLSSAFGFKSDSYTELD